MASRREPRFGFEQETLEVGMQEAIRARLPLTRRREERLAEAEEAETTVQDEIRPHDLGSRFRASLSGIHAAD